MDEQMGKVIAFGWYGGKLKVNYSELAHNSPRQHYPGTTDARGTTAHPLRLGKAGLPHIRCPHPS
jgi:hypothetical protein